MNSVNLIGRLADSPDVRYGKKKDDTTWGRFPLAIQMGENDVHYFQIVCFNNTAEFLEKYFAKGDRIGISGYLRQNVYEDNDGVTQYKVEIIATRIEFADGQREQNEDEEEEDFNVNGKSKSKNNRGNNGKARQNNRK